MNKLFLIFSGFCLFLVSCSDKPLTKEEQLAKDIAIIEQYLTDNHLTAEKTETGLYYIINTPGSGSSHPNINSTVIVNYKGYFTDNSIFDETSVGNPAPIELINVIQGWQEGLQLMLIGEKRTLLLPSYLAYGIHEVEQIPANSVLIFDIELVYF